MIFQMEITPEELTALRRLMARAEQAQPTAAAAINAGDVVQLRPGADPHWETSLMLVTQANAHQVRGQILRPHRGGCREAWGNYSTPEVARVGAAPYGEPAPDIRSWCYAPPCPLIGTAAEIAGYRQARARMKARLQTEAIRANGRQPTSRTPRAARPGRQPPREAGGQRP